MEGVGIGPVLAVGEGDRERRPRRAVHLRGFVRALGGVVRSPHPDQVHSDRVVARRGLVVHDAQDDAAGLVHSEVRRVAARLPARADDIELREGLPRTRCQDDVGERAAGDDEARREGDCQAFVQCAGFPPGRHHEIHRQGEPPVRREPHTAPVRRASHAGREQRDCSDVGSEADAERREVQEEAE